MTSASPLDRDAIAAMYSEAARRIAEKQPMMKFISCCGDSGCLNSCCMVSGLADDDNDDYRDLYRALFSPEPGMSEVSYWGNLWGRNAHACRILALCFMAAMVEAGDA